VGFADDVFARLGAVVEGPAGRVRFVVGTGSTVVLEVNHEGAALASARDEVRRAIDEPTCIGYRASAGHAGQLHVHHDQSVDRKSHAAIITALQQPRRAGLPIPPGVRRSLYEQKGWRK